MDKQSYSTNSRKKWSWLCLLTAVYLCLGIMSPAAYADMENLGSIDITLSHVDDGLLSGDKEVIATIYSDDEVLWQKSYSRIEFESGTATIPLGPFDFDELNTDEPELGLEIDGEEIFIPLAPTLYSYHSQYAKEAVALQDTDALFISDDSYVGINNKEPSAHLDVKGTIQLTGTSSKLVFNDETEIGGKEDILTLVESEAEIDTIFNTTITEDDSVGTVVVVDSDGSIHKRTLAASNWDAMGAGNGIQVADGDILLDDLDASAGEHMIYTGSEWISSGTVLLANTANAVAWDNITSKPNFVSSFNAGSGLALAGGTFSLDSSSLDSGEFWAWNGSAWVATANSSSGGSSDTATTANVALAVDWTNVANKPSFVSSYNAGDGLALSGASFSLDSTGLSSGQVLYWDGDSWEGTTLATSNVTYSAGTGLAHNTGVFSVDSTGFSAGDLFAWDGSDWIASSNIFADWSNITNKPSVASSYNAGVGLAISAGSISIDTSGMASNDFLLWNGSDWIGSSNAVSADTATTANVALSVTWDNVSSKPELVSSYSAGAMINISGGEISLDSTGLSTNQTIVWDGSEWITQTLATSNVTYSAGKGLDLSLGNFSIDETGFSAGDVLFWDGSDWAPTSNIATAGTATTANTALAVDWANVSSKPTLTSSFNAGLGLALSGASFSIDSTGFSSGDIIGWNGSDWVATENTGSGVAWDDITSKPEFTASFSAGVGLAVSGGEFSIDSTGIASNDLLLWNGSDWIGTTNIGSADLATTANTALAVAWDNIASKPSFTASYNAGDGLSLAGASFTLDSTGLSNGQVLYWDGDSWEGTTLATSNVTYSAGTGLAHNTGVFSVDSTGFSAGDLFAWNGSDWVPSSDVGADTATTANVALAVDWTNITNTPQLVSSYNAGSGITIAGGSLSLDTSVLPAWSENGSDDIYTTEKVGINTNDPSALFEIVSTGSTGIPLHIISSSDDSILKVEDGGGLSVGYGDIDIGNNKLAVNGTSYLFNLTVPAQTLMGMDPNTGTRGQTLYLEGVSAVADDAVVYMVKNGTDDESINDDDVLFMADGNGYVGIQTNDPTVAFQVGESGDGTVTKANSWGTFSDKRYKYDIQDIEDAVSQVQEIRGVRYKLKANDEDSIGFIAQEIEMVFPELVHTDTNGYKSVDYGRVTAINVAAIQEQQDEIDSLKAEIEELKAIIGELRSETE